MLSREYAAALRILAQRRDTEPDRFSTTLFHVGLPVATTILAAVDQVPSPPSAEAPR
jgi:hypothetical protein